MKPGLPWSVKGVSPDAREAAKRAAGKHGLTLGQYLNRLIFSDAADDLSRSAGAGAPPGDGEAAPPALMPVIEALRQDVHASDRTLNGAVESVNQKIEELGERLDLIEQKSAGPWHTGQGPLAAGLGIVGVAALGVIVGMLVAPRPAPPATGAIELARGDANTGSVAGRVVSQELNEPGQGLTFGQASRQSPALFGDPAKKSNSDAVEQEFTPSGDTAKVSAALSPPKAGSEATTAPQVGSDPTARVAQVIPPPARPETLPPAGLAATENLARESEQSARLEALLARAGEGDADATYQIAVAHANGSGVEQDDAKAAEWFRRAAEKDVVEAQYTYAGLLERGRGVVQDFAEAARWYRRSGKAGHARSAHNLAVLYTEGNGVRQDYAAAVQWFTIAAERNFIDSQYNLAVMYENGLGTPVDLEKAYLWYALAARKGDQDAAIRRDIVSARLGDDALATARASVTNWAPVPN